MPTDTCAICRNKLYEPSIEAQASAFSPCNASRRCCSLHPFSAQACTLGLASLALPALARLLPRLTTVAISDAAQIPGLPMMRATRLHGAAAGTSSISTAFPGGSRPAASAPCATGNGNSRRSKRSPHTATSIDERKPRDTVCGLAAVGSGQTSRRLPAGERWPRHFVPYVRSSWLVNLPCTTEFESPAARLAVASFVRMARWPAPPVP